MNFLQQLEKLRESVPHPAILTVRSENCNYCPYMAGGKNSYLMIGHNQNEDCFYGYFTGFCQDTVDTAFTEKSQWCYECIDCKECYNCNFCQDCLNCSNSELLYDCKNCTSCFLCINLRHKQFYILNRPFSKKEYDAKIAELKKLPREKLFEMFEEEKTRQPHIFMQGYNNENVTGNHISWSKNAHECFNINDTEDCFYIGNGYQIKDCMDCNYIAMGSELNYFCHSAVSLYNSNFCDICWYSQNLEYSEYVFNSHDCFGCISLNHASYRILNVQYKPEEYWLRVAEIKTQMKKEGIYGEFFKSNYPEL